MESRLPFRSTVKATLGFLPWQSVGAPVTSFAAAEVGFLREGISSLADSTFARLAFCEAMMQTPRGQTHKTWKLVFGMLNGPTGILPQPFGGNGVGHQPANPAK
jgi:hypothetical protein